MSRLFKVTAGASAIAERFQADMSDPVLVPEATVEGSPGLIVLETRGRRVLKALPWGFPRLTREMRARGDPPSRIGLVADLINPLWEQLVADPRYRCLIPITHFANPAGRAGEKTRTWFALKGTPLMAWAGFCRNTPAFGPVFAAMTTDANELVMPYNNRMPVLLGPEDHDRWLHGTVTDVIGFQYRQPIASAAMTIEHSEALWRSGTAPQIRQPELTL